MATRSGLVAPTLHVWASGVQNNGAFGWTGAATKDITDASKKHEALAQKELAKLKQVGTKALLIDRSNSTSGVDTTTTLGIGLGLVALLAFRQCSELR